MSAADVMDATSPFASACVCVCVCVCIASGYMCIKCLPSIVGQITENYANQEIIFYRFSLTLMAKQTVCSTRRMRNLNRNCNNFIIDAI